MRSVFFIILIVLITSSELPAQHWVMQTSPNRTRLNRVAFVDTSNGWAVGNSGLIIHTSNHGISWNIQTSNTPKTLRDLAFVSPSTGWVVGDSGLILHTTDSGNSWNPQISGTLNFLNGVDFVDSLYGWTVGTSWIGDTTSVILHTTDGGNVWSRQFCGSVDALTSIQFIDRDHGWMSHDRGAVYRTQNGGSTWRGCFIEWSLFMSLYQVSMVDCDHGWVVGGNGGMVLHSFNVDSIWRRQPSGMLYYFSGVASIDTNTCWVVGENGNIRHTLNGGTTWLRDTIGITRNIRGVSFIDAMNGWAVGDSGTILYYHRAPLQVPQNFTIAADTPAVNLSWSAVPGAGIQYNIYREDVPYHSFHTLVGTTSDTTYLDLIQPATTCHYYVVRAYAP